MILAGEKEQYAAYQPQINGNCMCGTFLGLDLARVGHISLLTTPIYLCVGYCIITLTDVNYYSEYIS